WRSRSWPPAATRASSCACIRTIWGTSSASRAAPRARSAWRSAPRRRAWVARPISRSRTDEPRRPAVPLVLIGRIGRPHGVRGEVTLDGASLTPLELHSVGEFTWRGPRGETTRLDLVTARPANTRMLLGFEGYRDRERAATLARGELLADSE